MKQTIIFFFWLLCISTYGQDKVLVQKISKLDDSIKVGNLVVYNAFKYQVLSHRNNQYDTSIIVDKVYKPYPELWDSCLALMFGDAGKIFRQKGIIEWNKTLFEKQPQLLKKLDTLSNLNLDSLFNSHLKGIIKLTGLNPIGKWVLYLGPDQNFSLEIGGCSSNGMAIDLAHSKITKDVLTEAMPHEFEHMVFEQAKSKDPDWGTDLGATIDEGLACYFTYEYFKRKLSKYRVIEQMTKEQFQWYLEHEKEIFEKSLSYLRTNKSGQNPYKCNCRAGGCKKLFDQAPKTICYFLGFRILEFYTKKHGKNSWTDAYKISMKELVKQSGYSKYLKALRH
jgi:Predicted Zn-dependent protease (DUF2268)